MMFTVKFLGPKSPTTLMVKTWPPVPPLMKTNMIQWKNIIINGDTSSFMVVFLLSGSFSGGCTTNEKKNTTVRFHFSNPAEGSRIVRNALNPHS